MQKHINNRNESETKSKTLHCVDVVRCTDTDTEREKVYL